MPLAGQGADADAFFPAFEPAHVLYERAGFVECSPFGAYTDTAFSRYFTLEVGAAG